jgi:hypothetical protein
MPISFFNLPTQEFAGLSGKNKFELDITNFYNSSEFDMPYFIFVVFQTNRQNNQEIDSSKFDHCGLQNIYLKNGRNETFPEESWNLDPPRDFLKAYDSFVDFKRITRLNTEMSILPIEQCPIFVINMFRRKNIVTPLKTSMKLCATFNYKIPDKTLCYVIMYGKKNLTYDGIIHEDF